jgi:hypothetical protein
VDEARQQYTVRAATIAKLVEHVTRRTDTDFKMAFLLTYRTMCTPRQLLDLLTRRFQVPQPVGASPDDQARSVSPRPAPLGGTLCIRCRHSNSPSRRDSLAAMPKNGQCRCDCGSLIS